MSRTARLFELLDALRAHRRPVTAAQIAEGLSVSVRTVYRDVQTLIGLGAPIDGGAGLGYVMRTGFFLPPLMFSEEELEALVLGARWVREQGDAGLAQAAESALAKLLRPRRATCASGSRTPGCGRRAAEPMPAERRRSARCARRSAASVNCGSDTWTPLARRVSGRSGRSRSHSSKGRVSWRPGASCAGIFVTSAPIGSGSSIR